MPAWKRPMKPASEDWRNDPRLVERNEKVKGQLAETEDWFEQQPATSEWEKEASERMARVKTHAARLGQRVVRGECRVGVCRLEVERDPTSKQHVRMRPKPRVIRHPDGSKMVRLMKDGSLRTIFYLVDE